MPIIHRRRELLEDRRQTSEPQYDPSFSQQTERIRSRHTDPLQYLPIEDAQLTPRSLFPSTDAINLSQLDISAQPLIKRQTYISNLPATYAGLNNGPAAGTVVGIVLGVVLGYLLLFWLIIAVLTSRASPQYIEADETEIELRGEHHSSKRSRRSHRSRRAKSESSVSERPPPRVQREPSRLRTERIVVQERTQSRAPPPRSTSRDVHESISININEDRRSRQNERRVAGDDVVEVVEENTTVSSESTPDPKPSRREARRSGVRHVDPNAYAGGNYPRHEISRERDRSRR